jgi:hypothetical protein
MITNNEAGGMWEKAVLACFANLTFALQLVCILVYKMHFSYIGYVISNGSD